VRGTAKVDIVDGIFPRYLEGARRLVPAGAWDEFEQTVRGTYAQMARIEITPTWAELMDFETRVPDFIEKLMRGQQSGSAPA
jgi:hypothetical protein